MPKEEQKVVKRSANFWKDYKGKVSDSFKIHNSSRRVFTEEEIESWDLPYRIQTRPK